MTQILLAPSMLRWSFHKCHGVPVRLSGPVGTAERRSQASPLFARRREEKQAARAKIENKADAGRGYFGDGITQAGLFDQYVHQPFIEGQACQADQRKTNEFQP